VHAAILLVWLRKLSFLTFFGFVVVMVAGPVLAVLGLLISFAIIGLLVWVPLTFLGFGRPIEWHQVREVSHKCWGAVAINCNRLGGGIIAHGQLCFERARETGRYIARVCRETMSGILVGAMLGLIPAAEEKAAPILLGACLGAFVGAMVGLSSREPARETVQPHSY
jgi:hypothetical protein